MIEPLTPKLYLDLNGELPPFTVRGVASTEDGVVLAFVGLTFVSGHNFIIFGAKPDFNMRDIIRGWRSFKKMLNKDKDYFAIIDRDLETAPGMLKHFNFTHVVDDVYLYEGD